MIIPSWLELSSLSRIAGRPLRIAYGRVFQETNAFSPLPTTRAVSDGSSPKVRSEAASSSSWAPVRMCTA